MVVYNVKIKSEITKKIIKLLWSMKPGNEYIPAYVIHVCRKN